jgi:hypothetical protein
MLRNLDPGEVVEAQVIKVTSRAGLRRLLRVAFDLRLLPLFSGI